VALIGFTEFERAHIESTVQTERGGRPSYVLCDALAACSLAVVDADQAHSVDEVVQLGRLGSSVMLGQTPRPGAAVQLPRPINPPMLLRALDHLLHIQAPISAAVQRVRDDLYRLARPAQPRQRMDHILVVDDNDAVLRFVAAQLQRYGFEAHLERDGSAAIARAARLRFAFVFIAARLEDMDGFQVCRAIKQAANACGEPPVVAMLLADDAAVSRLRAEKAGADAWLQKPVSADRLLSLVGEREVRRLAEAETTRSASTLL
jgi:CheY-like chemotaxis protein